jgi:hypothetical protein
VGNKAYISVGTAIIESDGTSIATASTLNFGTLFKVTGAEDYAEIDFAGLTAFQGTASLGQFIDIDLGQGVVGSIGTGSLAGTLSLSGTGMEFISGASTVSGVFEAVAGSGVSFLETASGTITINAPGLISAVHGTNGVSASIASGTLDLSGTLLELIEGTTTLTGILGLVAGANVSISGTSGGLGTLAVLSTAASGFYYGGTLFTALAAGSNITLTPSGTTLVASGAAGGGYSAGTVPTVVQVASSTSSSGSAAFAVAPTAGNLLVAMNFNPGSASAGTGWTQQVDNTSGTDYGLIFTKIAGAGESTTQTPVSGASAGATVIWEISGQAGSNYFQAGLSQAEQTGTTNLPIIAANAYNCLSLAAVSVVPGGTIAEVISLGTQDVLANTGTRYLAAGHTDLSKTPLVGPLTIFSANSSSKGAICLIQS